MDLEILLLCFVLVLEADNVLGKKKSLNMDPIDMADWDLPGDRDYQTFHKLSAADFQQKVIQSQDAWIVLIYQEKIHKKWRRQAENLKASLWYGSVEYDKEPEFVKELIPDIEQYDINNGIVLLYPYGRSIKQNVNKWPKVAAEPEEAEILLKPSFPNKTFKFTFTRENMPHFQKWIVLNYYKSDPPKFPVLCVTEESEPPLSLLSLSNYFSNFFGFGVVHKDDLPKLLNMLKRIPHPKVYPHYLLLLGNEPTSEELKEGKYGITFDVLPFNPQKYGEAQRFLSVTKFLFTANEDYREQLLGKRSDESEELRTMQPVKKYLKERVKEISTINYSVKTEL